MLHVSSAIKNDAHTLRPRSVPPSPTHMRYMIAEATHVALATRHRLSCATVPYRCTGVRVLPKSSVDGDTMFQVCMCIPRQLAEFGDRVVSKCRTVSCVHFTQCEEDDPGTCTVLSHRQSYTMDTLKCKVLVHPVFHAAVSTSRKASLIGQDRSMVVQHLA